MNDKLDDIIEALPTSQGAKKESLLCQLKELRDMSDTFIEEWLLFEEKMAKAKERPAEPQTLFDGEAGEASFVDFGAIGSDSPDRTMPYQRGEGYFKLFMFPEAMREFQTVVESHPEFLPARLYLALCYLQSEHIVEAFNQLQIIIALADDERTKAVAYNALGCVQAMKGDIERACECFRTSQALDPGFKDPVYNLKACQIEGGVLQLGVAIG